MSGGRRERTDMTSQQQLAGLHLSPTSAGKHFKQDSKPRQYDYKSHSLKDRKDNHFVSDYLPSKYTKKHNNIHHHQSSYNNTTPTRSGERRKNNSISLNHLLNFTLTPREVANDHHDRDYFTPHKRGKKQRHFNKEQYLQANCQFVVKEGVRDVSTDDPDSLVNWDYIEQVRLFCNDIPSCPICLYPPSSAKISRCGHVFCYSCILHYLALSERKWHKCPICYESIYKKDLKSVATLSSQVHDEGDTLTMRLMKRYKTGTLSLPRAQWTTDITGNMIPFDDVNCMYGKILSATLEQIRLNVIENERCDLERQLKELSKDEESERCFIESALFDIKERHDSLIKAESIEKEINQTFDKVLDSSGSQLQTDLSEAPPISHGPVWTSYHHSYIESDHYQPPFSDNEEEEGERRNDSPDNSLMSDVKGDDVISSHSDDNGDNSFGSINSSPTSSDFVYFYQSSDGQHLYLHPINAKCLLMEYGSWENCPDTVTAQIVEVTHFTMNEHERSRYHYLGHLPLTCGFSLCELDIKPPVISHTTLQQFSGQLLKRKTRRQKKRREEKKRERNHDRPSPVEIPTDNGSISPEGLHNLLSMAASPPLSSPLRPISVASNGPDDGRGGWSPGNRGYHGPSFAQALVSGDKKTPLKSANKGPVKTCSPLVPLHKDSIDEDNENQEVPSFSESFSDALANVSKSMQAAKLNTGGKPGGSKTAKKGCKKLVLFSTGGGQRRL